MRYRMGNTYLDFDPVKNVVKYVSRCGHVVWANKREWWYCKPLPQGDGVLFPGQPDARDFVACIAEPLGISASYCPECGKKLLGDNGEMSHTETMLQRYLDWLNYMMDKYGPEVYLRKTSIPWSGHGDNLDWRVALCAEVYGKDQKWPAIPTERELERAEAWRNGDWPEWLVPWQDYRKLHYEWKPEEIT